MLILLIDTNVYLDFFHFGKDDLSELEKLAVAVKSGDVRLLITHQVWDEFQRNREPQIAKSIDGLSKMKLPEGIPRIVRDYPEFNDLQKAKQEFGGRLNSIIERLTKEARERSLAADHLLGELMQSAESIAVTDEIMALARRRVEVGNPPGKRGSLGDAINWECLLSKAPHGTDLHLVTADADFASTIRAGHMAQFLADEWATEKRSHVHLHEHLGAFFLDKFPEIRLAVDLEKELRVRRLVESGSFDATHRAIEALRAVEDLSEEQVGDLLEAARYNSQINWIRRDHDVYDFFHDLVDTNAERLTEDEMAGFRQEFDTRGYDDL